VALADCVSKLIFGHIHHVSGDGAYGNAGAGTAAFVLMLLVVGFPTPFQLKTSLLPLKDDIGHCGHLMPFCLASQREFSSAGKQSCDHEEGYRFGILFEPMQHSLPPLKMRKIGVTTV
jgi:hypothetical protein